MKLPVNQRVSARPCWIALVTLLASFGLMPARATVIEVQPGADPQRAFALARLLRVRSPADRIVVEFTAGTHYLTKPVTLTARDSGTAASPLEIRAAPGASATLSGGRRLEQLVWRPWHSGIWRTQVSGPSFELLWRDGMPLVRARYPNFDPAIRPFGGVSKDAMSASRIRGWSNPSGGIIHALSNEHWGSMFILIEGKDVDGKLRLAAPVGMNRQVQPSESEVFVDNILEELDAEDEWYLDRSAHCLYLKTPNGKRPQRAEYVASRLETLINLHGSAKASVHDIHISGINFRDTAPTFFKTTEPLLRSDWMFHRAGAVLLEDSERVLVESGVFAQLGGNAIVISGRNRDVAIRGNEIYDVGASAIAFVGRPKAVRSPLFEYRQSQLLSAIDRIPGPIGDSYPADSVAEDNLIHDIGEVEKQSAGIEISMAARIAVRHNSIYRVPRAGINIGDGTWGGHQIVDNDVFDTVLETGDHGAFNSWGRDRYWDPDRAEMNRRVVSDPALIGLDAVEPTTLRHNRFRCDHGWDIDLDDGSSNYLIEDNLMLAGGLKLREGFGRIARNNILVNNTLHPHAWFANSEDVFEHNIVMTGYQPILIDHWGKSIDYNLFPTRASLERAVSKGTDAHSIAGNPQFLAPVDGNFAVAPDSPATLIGFKNFSMDDFGVTSPRLKFRAEHPSMPDPVVAEPSGRDAVPRELLGMTVKSVETPGEQSATGLASMEGALVLAVAPNSAAGRAGLVQGDVILRILDDQYGQSDSISTVADLVAAYQGRRWRGEIEFEIWRNQMRSAVKVIFR
jgi:hypothetical protein